MTPCTQATVMHTPLWRSHDQKAPAAVRRAVPTILQPATQRQATTIQAGVIIAETAMAEAGEPNRQTTVPATTVMAKATTNTPLYQARANTPHHHPEAESEEAEEQSNNITYYGRKQPLTKRCRTRGR